MSFLQDFVVRLQNSSASPGVLIFAIFALVVVLGVVVGLGFYISHLMSPRGRLDLLLDRRETVVVNRNPWPLRIFVILMLIAVAVSAGTYLGEPGTCASCHNEFAYSKSLGASAHAKVACMDCHGGTGIVGPVDNTLDYASWGWAFYVKRIEPKSATLSASVSSRACLRCHEGITSSTVTVNGIRVRHKEILDSGAQCTSCHSNTSHAIPGVKGAGPNMNSCLPCHDGRRAPSACPTCHATDFGIASVQQSQRNTAVVSLSGKWNSCYECHDQNGCTRCHGVVMPHPPGWGPTTTAAYPVLGPGSVQPGSTGLAPGDHARAGFAHREVCWRCHHAPGKVFVPDVNSCPCHGLQGQQYLLGGMHGGSAWVKEHGLEATGQKVGTYSNCASCHGDPATFCTFCHPASMAARYAPLAGGADNYSRLETMNAGDLGFIGQ